MAKKLADICKSFDVNDIIGARYGKCCIVDEYAGVKEFRYDGSDKPVKAHMYKVHCELCGGTSIIKRSSIIKASRRDGIQCKHCAASNVAKTYFVKEEVKVRAIENGRTNGRANVSNMSTGIKHYSISKRIRHCGNSEYVRYTYQVKCIVDGVEYKIAQCERGTYDINIFLGIANELNDVLKNGKEAFYEWYKDFKKIQNDC